MALIKRIDDPNDVGQIDAYYRWSMLHVEPIAGIAAGTFDVYASEAARDAEKPMIDQKRIDIRGEDFGKLAMTTIGQFLPDVSPQTPIADILGAISYGFVKSQPDMADAKEV